MVKNPIRRNYSIEAVLMVQKEYVMVYNLSIFNSLILMC